MTQAIKTSFSPGTGSDQINRRCERSAYCIEWYLKVKGHRFAVSLLSGLGRAVFGVAQIVGSIVFFYLRAAHAGITYLYNRPLARLRTLEANRSVVYFAHGGVNIFRGILEALQILALMRRFCGLFLFQCENDYAYHYPSRAGAALTIRQDSEIEDCEEEIELTEMQHVNQNAPSE